MAAGALGVTRGRDVVGLPLGPTVACGTDDMATGTAGQPAVVHCPRHPTTPYGMAGSASDGIHRGNSMGIGTRGFGAGLCPIMAGGAVVARGHALMGERCWFPSSSRMADRAGLSVDGNMASLGRCKCIGSGGRVTSLAVVGTDSGMAHGGRVP